MNKLLWRILDWIHSVDPSLVEVDENQAYRVNWGEVACLPEFTLGVLRCKLFKRHGLPFMGSCLYCGKELEPGDYIGWRERYDPAYNEYHALLADPFKLMGPIIKIGIEHKFQKAHEDADTLYLESHK